jgi:hypothetical protein
MTIVDDFKSEQNRNIIFQASNKMLLDKYKLSLNSAVLINIINAIISSMSKDAILMNNTIKLMELNTITLAKMKDYVIKNIDAINAANAANAANIDNNKVLNEVVVANAASQVSQVSQVDNTGDISSSIEADNYKTEVLTNEELLIRVKEYENKRNISNAVLANIANNIDLPPPPDANSANAANTTTNMNIIPEIIEKVFSSMNTNTSASFNKKTLIIHSYSRDWINCPQRNKLSFTINIDLQNNIIEPLKILFPKFVKDITPYIVLVITDNHKTFKYNFLYSKSSGKWDIWKLINKDNNINNNINLANKNWKISFQDYLNNDLNLGTDDIKVSQINDYNMNTYDKYDNNISIDTNIDNILMPSSADTKANTSSFYEINIDYSNILEYDEYNLNTISKYDYMQLKTYGGKYANVKVIDVNSNIGKIIISNENNLAKEDFINSSLLNYSAQYSLILTYSPRSNP